MVKRGFSFKKLDVPEVATILKPKWVNCSAMLKASALSSLQTESVNELLSEMNNHAPKFRFLIGKNIQLKSVPFVTFRYDDTLEHVSKIEDLLKK